MSIYQAKRRKGPVVALCVAAALLGLLAGWLLWGRAEPDPIAALAPTRATLADAASAVDVVAAHGQFAAEGGQDPPDYAGSPEAVARAATTYRQAAGVVESIAPETAAAIRTQLDELGVLVDEGAPPDEVIAAAEELASTLRTALGP